SVSGGVYGEAQEAEESHNKKRFFVPLRMTENLVPNNDVGVETPTYLIQNTLSRCERVEFQLEQVRKLEIRERVKKAAFTLAEVLITLGIIGVVTAMTIPNVVTNYQKKLTEERLKHGYALLHSAIRRSAVNNGPVDGWTFNNNGITGAGQSSKDFFFNYLNDYLKVSDYCGIRHTEYMKFTKGKESCSKMFVHGDSTAYSVILMDNIGLSLRSDATNTSHIEVQMDINGPAGPNRSGRDAFIFYIDANKGLIPFPDDLYGMKPCTRTLKNPNGYADWAGWGCASVIMQNNWKIPADYPWNDL
ncbi:MAG: type II secretion system GspH family protein, partial [Muribaculaceae bacterium]|nr:type II secretion system GspH family protein [Muribaculaceae bacterium]